MNSRNRDLWRAAADRAAERSFFLGSVLREYQELRGMDDEQLANDLGCDLEDLPRLALCRRPDREVEAFRADVERIAVRFGIAPAILARVVREADAARQLRRGPKVPTVGDLLAAREREVDYRPSSAGEADRAPGEAEHGETDTTAGDGEPA